MRKIRIKRPPEGGIKEHGIRLEIDSDPSRRNLE
jgi:hypothetical protein